MENESELIFVGAEAEVRLGRFVGLPVVEKHRIPKSYRRPELDARIRRERTRAEVQILFEAHRANVAVPRVLDVDLEACMIRMEKIDGDPLRRLLEENHPKSRRLCQTFGQLVGRLHAAGIVHGDLTTSNVLVEDDRLTLVDFGLAQKSKELEDQGVDLHLVERTFEASHPNRPECLQGFLEGYPETFSQASRAVQRMQEIKARARYV